MAIKISQLDEVTTLTGNEEIPVALDGSNKKFKVLQVKQLITKSDVGLGNVNNTSDLDKPISTAVQSALNSKAPYTHQHTIGQISNLQDVLDSKSNTNHGHALSDLPEVGLALASKSDVGHGHALSELPDVQTALDSKANSSHNHNVTDITGLQNALDAKASTIHQHDASDIANLNITVEQIISNMPSIASDVSVNNIEW